MSPYPTRDVCVAVRGCPLNVDSGRSTSKIFYAETFATTIRAISGLSRAACGIDSA